LSFRFCALTPKVKNANRSMIGDLFYDMIFFVDVDYLTKVNIIKGLYTLKLG